MKRAICILLSILLMSFSQNNSIVTKTENEHKEVPRLSSLSEEQQLFYIESNGVTIPSYAKDYVIEVISEIEKDSRRPISINNPVLYEAAIRIKQLVNQYYGCSDAEEITEPSRYSLVDSTIYSSWDPAFEAYNCYSYVLGLTSGFSWPGEYSVVSNPTNLDYSLSVYNFALYVRADLKSSYFGKQCVKLTTTRPSSLASGQSCYAIRKCHYDFHFMKMFGSDWRHKPGDSTILRYNYQPYFAKTWNNECSKNNVCYEPTTYYNSNIYYILSRVNHPSTTYKWTGEHYHSGNMHYFQYGDQCDECGDFINLSWISQPCAGPPCTLPSSKGLNPESSEEDRQNEKIN